MQIHNLLFIFVVSLSIVSCDANHVDTGNKQMYAKAQLITDQYSGQGEKLNEVYRIFKAIEESGEDLDLAYIGYGRLSYKAGYINYGNYSEKALDQSRHFFDLAISLSPKSFDAYFYGAYPYIFSKDFNKARVMAEKAQSLLPGSGKVDLLFAEIAKKEGDLDTVIEKAKRALQKDPGRKITRDAYALLSSAYKRQKKFKLAEKSYLKVIELDPESPWAKINYSNFLWKYIKNYDQAIEQGEKALALMDFGMGHKVLSDAYYAKAAQLHWDEKKYQDSKEYFQKSIEHNPENANAYYGLGSSYYHVGHQNKDIEQIKKAKALFEKALEIELDHKQAKRDLKSVVKLIKSIEVK